MFRVHCAGHGREVLLFPGSYEVHNTDGGIVVTWACTCGVDGAFVTGRRRVGVSPTTVVHPALPGG